MEKLTSKAEALGSTRADSEFQSGAFAPQGGPLSGEWAGDMTPSDLLDILGVPADTEGDLIADDLMSAYEGGYFGTWDALRESPC